MTQPETGSGWNHRPRGDYIELRDELVVQTDFSCDPALRTESSQLVGGLIAGRAVKDVTNSDAQHYSPEESKSSWKPSRWRKKRDTSSDATRIGISERPQCKQFSPRGCSKRPKNMPGSPRRRHSFYNRHTSRSSKTIKTMLTIEEHEEFDLGSYAC
mmetsp:Transcript_291/g.528  ORF Transcript_291/g.528 Transcript_291/m.528 type:complete len:157 (-) Transcript_291:136-606(-)|eukprot:CAMPEP_0201935334 /NCGR_PEP_ID=MMETSP0903-20130614/35260_1 /ASSEMBLY_ACC=CAM_ASM_000552 /TAXON_ID=420261 /ORGANISM="Thalassiosira antarctica, Strain CCMP982" /LENGTH=156 /DNA_ID=CAMNT_0048475729 /DNA_START=57 /DNA_END=527 /DNA_ORIENTATION=-